MIFFYCLFGTMAAVLIGYGAATWWAAKNPQHNVGPSDIDEWRATYGKFEGWPNVAPKK